MTELPINVQLPDLKIRQVSSVSEIHDPLYTGEGFQVNQHEFALQVPAVGSFYACDGSKAEYFVESGADPDWVRLYLNGQVLVALLHQRRILNFHASSFIHNGRGVMILGETGAGKSSLTAAFAIKGARLLTDDVTPVVFSGSEPHIRPLHGSIRIRKHTAEQLNVDPDKLREAEAGTGKQYLHVGDAEVEHYPLHLIMKIEIGEVSRPEFVDLLPVEMFSFLRSEICMSEILAGMPETESDYLKQLLHIVEQVRFGRVVRPAEVKISVLHAAVRDYLAAE